MLRFLVMCWPLEIIGVDDGPSHERASQVLVMNSIFQSDDEVGFVVAVVGAAASEVAVDEGIWATASG